MVDVATPHVHGDTCEHPISKRVGPAWVPAVVVGAVALGTCILLNVRDPNESGSWGFCPFKLATGGLDCPGCGLLRGTRALTRGDIGAALDHNVLIVPILGTMLVAYGVWAARSFGWRNTTFRADARWVWLAGPILVAFWVMRNLPWFPFLDSGIS
jgi:hypothetical protein